MKKCRRKSVGSDMSAILAFDPKGTDTPPIWSCQGLFLKSSFRMACVQPPPTPASITRSIGEVHTNMKSVARKIKR